MTPVDVTARDVQSGDRNTIRITDDYVLTTGGSCYLDHVEVLDGGTTHVITDRGRRPDERAGR